jgi:hypothetical protein
MVMSTIGRIDDGSSRRGSMNGSVDGIENHSGPASLTI